MQLLQPLNHQMPRTQQQCDELCERMRSIGHLSERSPGNIGSVLGRGRGTGSGNFSTTLKPPKLSQATGPQAYGPAILESLLPY
eukprot:5844044-Pyramimonas_sp.AAC.1